MADRFQHLFDSIAEQVVVVDRNLRITYANPAWLESAGEALSQVTGQSLSQVLTHTVHCSVEEHALQQAVQSGKPVRVACPGCKRHRQAVQLAASPILEATGEVGEVLQITHPTGITVDTTAQPSSTPDTATALRSDVDIAEALREVALLAGSAQGLPSVLDAILEQLGRAVDYDSASISLLEKQGWRIIAGRGFPSSSDLTGLLFPLDDPKQTWMQENRKPRVVEDVQQDPEWLCVRGTEYIRSWIGAPLLANGQMIGTLNLDKTQPGFYHSQDSELVMAFANQAAVAINSARLLEKERQRAAQLSLISTLSQRVLSILDPVALLDFAVQAIQTQFGYYYVDVFLTDTTGEYAIFETSSLQEYVPIWREMGLKFRVGQEGLIGHATCTGLPYVANDVQQEPAYISDPLLAETRSELVMPIKAGGRVIGVLDFNSEQINAFDEDDLFVAQSLASQLALGLENARLYRATQQRVAELEAVRQASLSLTSSLELQDVLETILESTLRLLTDVQDAHVFLYQAERLIFGAALWADGRKGKPWAEPRSDGLTYTVARRGEPIVVPDMKTHPLFVGAPKNWEGSIVGLPLKISSRVVGVMSVAFSQPHELPETELNILYLLADQTAIAIENARLFEEIRKHVAQLESQARDMALVHEFSRLLSSSLDLTHILETATEQMMAVFDADHSGILLFDQEHNRGRVVAEFPRTGAIEETFPVEGYFIAEQIIADREPVMVEDVLNDPRMTAVRQSMQRLNIRSMLVVPLVIKDKTVGSIGLDAIGRQRHFDDQEIALAQTIANQVAYALDNARLYQETQQRLKELTLLFESSAAVSTSLDANMVVHTTIEQMARALGASGGAIFAWEREQDVLVNLVDYLDHAQLRTMNGQEPGSSYKLAEYPASRWVLDNRHPLILQPNGDQAGTDQSGWLNRSDAISTLLVPMIVRDEVIGILELYETSQKREFTETEINLCQTLANQAAAALENARLFEETEARIRDMAAVAIVGQAMTTLELDEVLSSIAENALKAAQAEISSVYLLDAERKLLIPRSVYGLHNEELEQGIFEMGEGTIGQVALSGQSLIVPEIETDEIFVPKSQAARQIHNTLTVPLAVRGMVIGTLEVCNKIGAPSFTATDQRLLSAFAAQAAIAIDNARLYQEVSSHLEEVLILNKAAGAATSTLDFDQAIHRSMVALLEMPHFERAHVLLLDPVKNELWLHPASAKLAIERLSSRIPLGQGICGRVAQTGVPLRIGDVRQESNYIIGYLDTLSELCVPLRVGNRNIGVLDVQSSSLNAFSESDERLLTTFASQLSTVIDNARLFNETQLRLRELTALTQVSRALNEAQGLNTILGIVLEETFSLLDCQEGSIILMDPPGSNRLQIVAERGLGPEAVEKFNNRPVYAYEGTYKRALRSGQIVEVADTLSDPDFLHDVGSHARRVTNIPLITERGAIGLIAVDRLPADETTRRLVTTLASMAAVAIDKERLHQETTDRLAEVSTLYTLATQITGSLSLSSVLDSIVTILKLTLDCRACCIFLIDSTGDYLKLEAGTGLSPTWKEVARLRLGEGVSGRVIDERRSIYVPDTTLEPDFIFFDPNIRSLLVVPLIVRDKAIGTLSIDDMKPNAFDNELRLLTIAAAQAAVAIENAQLYESLRRSYSELEQAYNELRELDKMKSEFVQNISHELRTPLTFIKGYVELLVDGDMGELTADQMMAMNIVATKADALSRLVDDIISLQQAGREQLRFEHLSLVELGRAAIQAAQASATDAGITLHDEIPDDLMAPVLVDRRRVVQVFDNLLGNAIKFSNPGDTVTVRMFDEEAVIRTEVEDTGIGIPDDKLPRIFDRFYQVDGTTTRRFGGTGLGLTIVKQIVEAHGGEVGAKSQVGKGSLLFFTIPKTRTS